MTVIMFDRDTGAGPAALGAVPGFSGLGPAVELPQASSQPASELIMPV